ncbi:glycosyltransferase family 4 protein [Nitrosomonas supralitoralis]|uniref:Glycosyl transferase n=1 Tax=Nitrosomonas supralitoralis TaxID=2116706 RepID=A0A2P7NWY7_9PROT|nr:glycosyltransferase family 4 protein [Nitrosomonas supralitoralis]PSJ17971.1 glycosyl transferase [Nitrosomonas supralitoralis]
MKIIFLTSSLGAGGAERVATTLCNTWAARGDRVILVPTFSGGGRPFYEISNDVELIYLADLIGSTGKSLLNYIKRLLALRRLIDTEKPDVVISFLPNVNVAAILSAFHLSVPVICCERRDPSSQPTTSFWELACRITYRFADMVVVQTEAACNSIDGIYPGIKCVRTMANPLPDEILQIEWGAQDKVRKSLLSIGRLSSGKQVDKSVSAFSKVASVYPDWDLHIYGDGKVRDELQSQIYLLGLQDRVFLLGRTTSPWLIMEGADAFVMTSKYEGFPNALLEAMGVGLACVVFDCPSGPRDITRDGQDAFLVPLDDETMLEATLRELMGNEALRTQMGRQARDSVIARYSLSSVIVKWDSLFNELGVFP